MYKLTPKIMKQEKHFKKILSAFIVQYFWDEECCTLFTLDGCHEDEDMSNVNKLLACFCFNIHGLNIFSQVFYEILHINIDFLSVFFLKTKKILDLVVPVLVTRKITKPCLE